jgi:hypothetical protein|tara:strand:+ start:372 stop:605 length:234 start_codon:yes stop_codon:yes gene_type:complete
VKKTRKPQTNLTADAHLRISYHEKICAERMKTLFKRIDEMGKDLKELKTFMNRGKGAGAIIFILLSILGSLFYFFKP